jgi:hypothetical protein
MRSLLALFAAAFIGLTFASMDASARPGGGFRGGGFHGGFHHGWHGGGFRRFGPGIGLGLGFAAGYPYYAYAGYPYYGYDSCVVPRRIWTPYGWRSRLVNVCY